VGWRRLAGGIAGAACVVALVVVATLAIAAGGSSGGYRVRAIFDDAGNLIPGENVKIDGVKVGTVSSVTPTPQAKAAVVLDIENPGFKDFRTDASCTIRPQALIGEKYVDCLPTQPRVEGTPLPPALKRIPSGHEGAGDYQLSVQHTSSPVDVDLLGDVLRLPERERFTLILNEFGAGLAGRGSDLGEVVKRANPALQELDKVFQILANENHVLAKLAVDSDAALKPFARVRQHVGDFIVQANRVSQAGAATRGSLKRNLELFPSFLEQLGPGLERVQHFAEQATPTFRDLLAAAPGLDKAFKSLPAFGKGNEAFFEVLGKTAKIQGPALQGARPLLKQLGTLGNAALPFTENFAQLFESLRNTGGLERIMDFIFLGTGSANGYDALGHFLRAEGVANVCLTYAVTPSSNGGCRRHLFNSSPSAAAPGSSTAAAASAPSETSLTPANAQKALDSNSTSVLMARTLAVMAGATPAQALAKYPGPTTSSEAGTLGLAAAAAESGPGAQPVGGSSAGTTYYTPGETSGAGGLLLNYLLGSE
jgi:phospholipid/cholesterol/gamma-HCH transport system substrate-binding protein